MQLTREGLETSDGHLLENPVDGEIHVRDIHGNCVDVYRRGDENYAEAMRSFRNARRRKTYQKLQRAKRKEGK